MKKYDIIKGPIITEKSSEIAQNNNQITLSVDTKANKIEIKDAVEKLFNVKVESVNTINVRPKKKRVGRYAGVSNRAKKAIVKLADGQTIDLG